jgi:hypothetical protein
MICQERPGIDPGFRFIGKIPQPVHKLLPVLVVIHDPTFFNPTDDHMVESSWSIESRLTGHRISFKISESGIDTFVAYLFNLVNNVPLFSFF